MKENSLKDETETGCLWNVLILLKGAKNDRYCKLGECCELCGFTQLEAFLQQINLELKILNRLKKKKKKMSGPQLREDALKEVLSVIYWDMPGEKFMLK